MRNVIAFAFGVLLLLGVVLVIRAVSDDNSSSDGTATKLQRQTTGAYDCMPPQTQSRFDRAVKQYEMRFEYVLEHAPRDAADRPVDEVLEADKQFVALRNRARSILVAYLPGGGEFDRACYERAVRRYDRRVALQE